MARTKKIDGFSFEDIVNTNINNDINDNVKVNVNDNSNVNDNLKDKGNFLENLKPEKEKKKLKHYSILILILPIIWTTMARNSGKKMVVKVNFVMNYLKNF